MERNPIDQRRKFVKAWNDTMVKMWTERIRKLGVIDTGSLLRSPFQLPVKADGRFYEIHLAHSFLEYGLWQDLGTGREVPIGNDGDIGREKKRERRRWFSVAYYSSIMNLRRFLVESIGEEFVGVLSDLDADKLRHKSPYYHRKGLS